MTIRTRMGLGVAVAIAVAVTALLAIDTVIGQRSAEILRDASARDRVVALRAQLQANEVGLREQTREIAVRQAAIRAFADGDVRPIRRVAEAQFRRLAVLGDADFIAVFSASGAHRFSLGVGPASETTRGLVRQALRTGRGVYGADWIERGRRRLGVGFAAPLRSDGETVGVVVLGRDLSSALSDIMRMTDHAAALFVDGREMLRIGRAPSARAVQASFEGDAPGAVVLEDGRRWNASRYTPELAAPDPSTGRLRGVAEPSVEIMVFGDVTEAYAPLDALWRLSLAAIGLMSLIVIWLSTRWIAAQMRPLEQVIGSLTALSEGREVGANRLEGRRDEIGAVARAVTRLSEALAQSRALATARFNELKSAKDRIEHNALHDALTGLPNRRFLDGYLADQAEQRRRDGREMALLHIDLDRFKEINDTLGHAAGDAVLRHAATKLSEAAEPDDVVARIGGDEFVVAPERTDLAGLEGLAERIVDEMRKPVEYEDQVCRLGCSVGVAVQQPDEIDPASLLVNADIALYRSKNEGRSCFHVFTPDMQEEMVASRKLADDVLRGIEEGEFIAYYQPQVDAHSRAIVGVEALARWRHPDKGLLTPGDFLTSAEALAVSPLIDRQIMEAVIADLKVWSGKNVEVERVGLNISLRRVSDPGFVDEIAWLGASARRLSFELVESIFIDEMEPTARENVERLRDLGFDIEIDDFGTGHASLVGLLNVQPSRLKIDKQFCGAIEDSEQQRRLISSIVEIARSLGVGVTAEGVETMGQADVMTNLGCDRLQGYAFSKPLAAPAFLELALDEPWRAPRQTNTGAQTAHRAAAPSHADGRRRST